MHCFDRLNRIVSIMSQVNTAQFWVPKYYLFYVLIQTYPVLQYKKKQIHLCFTI